MRVLVVGAAGQVGGSVVEQLLALPSPPSIRVSSRDPSKLTFPSAVEVVKADLKDPATYPTLFASVDRVFLYAFHGHDATSVSQLLQAMQTAGVKRVVFLSSKWVAEWPEQIFGRMHEPIEEAIKAAGFEYTFLRPGNFASNVLLHWIGPAKGTGGVVTLVRPNAHSAPVAPSDIAAVAVTALTTDGLVNAAPALTGPKSMTQQEQVDVINRARESTGASPIRVQLKTAEEWRAINQRMPPAFADAMLHYWEQRDGKPEPVQSSERLTGQPSTTFEQWVDQHKAKVSE